eukprot:gene2393-5870_t
MQWGVVVAEPASSGGDGTPPAPGGTGPPTGPPTALLSWRMPAAA